MGPPQRCVVVVVIVTTARILRSRYRNKKRRDVPLACAECGEEGGVSLVQIMYARQVLQCNVSSVKGIIGRRTKSNAKDVLSNYATRPCSRTLRPKRTVPFASYQCRLKSYRVSRFQMKL